MFQNSLSSETTLSSSIRVVVFLSPTLLERKGFAVFQNCLLSVIFLTLGCQSHFPFLFEILQHSDLFVCCKPVYTPKILYSGNLLRNLEWVIITFRTSLVIKEDWLFLKVFCFEGANLFKSPREVVLNNSDWLASTLFTILFKTVS